MKPLKSATKAELQKIKGVCLDIDETLSTHGKLTAEAFSALWKLKEMGFAVVPITGRPAGWCDHIARFWPVDAVVGENGAFSFFMENGVRKRIDTPAGATTIELKKKLSDLENKILKKFPEARFASDQAYREFDLAIDICEDVKPWTNEKLNELLKFCQLENAHAKLSSIHINIWFGDYDKKKGFETLLKAKPNLPAAREWLFIGDSPNDEPMFAAFPYSVGVANLKKYSDRLKNTPTWITENESGAGFAEMVEHLWTTLRTP